MRIEWAEKMAEVVKGNYEYYVDNDEKTVVRVYTPKGIKAYKLETIKRQIPNNFRLVGIFYCPIEMDMYILIEQL